MEEGSVVDESYIQQVFTFVSLFVAESVTALEVRFRTYFPLHVASVHTAIQHLPRLRTLTISSEDSTVSLDGIGLSPWTMTGLVKLNISCVSANSMHHLACLSHLEMLEIKRLTPHAAQLSAYQVPSTASFPQLKQLLVLHSEKQDFIRLLSYLPPITNTLHIIKALVLSSDPSMQDILDIIAERANPSSLLGLGLTVTNLASIDEQDIPFDMAEVEPLDISPLLPFRFMLAFAIHTQQAVHLKADDANGISKQWPWLRSLIISGNRPCRCIPLIDHRHIIAILEGCDDLQTLSLNFDASRITAQDCITKAPFKLQELYVGDSPIYSPSRVLAFLKANFSPQSLTLEIYKNYNARPSIFERRWKSVQHDWALLASPQ